MQLESLKQYLASVREKSIPDIVASYVLPEAIPEIKERKLELDSDGLHNEPLWHPGTLEIGEAKRKAAELICKHTLDPNEQVTLSQELERFLPSIRNQVIKNYGWRAFDEDSLMKQAATRIEKMSSVEARKQLRAMAMSTNAA